MGVFSEASPSHMLGHVRVNALSKVATRFAARSTQAQSLAFELPASVSVRWETLPDRLSLPSTQNDTKPAHQSQPAHDAKVQAKTPIQTMSSNTLLWRRQGLQRASFALPRNHPSAGRAWMDPTASDPTFEVAAWPTSWQAATQARRKGLN